MHIIEAVALSANGSDPEKVRKLEFAILEGLHEDGIDGFVDFKDALNTYIGVRRLHEVACPACRR